MSLGSLQGKTKQLVVPGERVAIIEEFFANANTYVANGDILAKVVGNVVMDYDRRKIAVRSIKSPPLPRPGETVLATVTRIREINAALDVFFIEDRGTYLIPPVTGTLHVLNISSTYVKSIYDAIGYGDVVRAKVIVSRPIPVILSIKGREYGVVFSRCPHCMEPLRKRGFTLYCYNCKKSVQKKIAAGYRVRS